MKIVYTLSVIFFFNQTKVRTLIAYLTKKSIAQNFEVLHAAHAHLVASFERSALLS